MSLHPTSAIGRDAPQQALVHISKREWDRGLDSSKLSKDELNQIVLDYLIVEGYRDAAIEFAAEAGLTLRVDVEGIQERMLIRDALEAGRVDEAIRRVNELDSEILDTNPSLYFHLQLQTFIELIRNHRVADALAYASRELAPRGAQNPEFLADLEKTMALLAFPELAAMDHLAASSAAPGSNTSTTAAASWTTLGSLMRKEHRTKVAKELNAAILESQGQGQETKLSGLIRLMSWGEGHLQAKGLVVPGINVSELLGAQ